MKILLLFLVLFNVGKSIELHASAIQRVETITVQCGQGRKCTNFRNKIEQEISTKDSLEIIINKIKYLLIDPSVHTFEYFFSKEKQSNLILKISFRKVVKEVLFTTDLNISEQRLKLLMPLKKFSYYGEQLVIDSQDVINKFLIDSGYGDNKIRLHETIDEESVILNYNLISGKKIKVEKVNLIMDSKITDYSLRSVFNNLDGEKWSKVSFNIFLEKLSNELFKNGYFFSKINVDKKINPISGNITINVMINHGVRYNFSFYGNKKINRLELIENTRREIRNNLGEFSSELIKSGIISLYEAKGIYNTETSFYTRKGTTKSGHNFINFYFEIKEGSKILVKDIIFNGNNILKLKYLEKLYTKHSTELASTGHFDRKYLDSFINILKEEYLKVGIMFPNITIKTEVTEPHSRKVFFEITEKNQTILRSFKLNLPNSLVESEIFLLINNKVGQPLNVVSLEKDFNTVLGKVKEQGYYFAKIININSNSIISYSENNQYADINLDINVKRIITYNDLKIMGNIKTKDKVIRREVKLNKNDVITPDIINTIKSNLLNLGLFTQVRVSPFIIKRFKDRAVSNLIIQLKEKDFGEIKIAPGYRTDLGYKISSRVNYNNINGESNTAGIKLQFNKRDDLSDLDERRREENKKLIEMDGRLEFSMPYLFNRSINFDSVISGSRKRFNSFDAEIIQTSLSLSKYFNKNYNFSLKYQLENIKQYDASKETDNGYFRIGGITPTISADFRDSMINPRNGSFFSLSCEYAGPLLFSMNNDNIKINFIKLVSRNKVYFSWSNWMLAISASLGYQKNLARDYIYDSNGNPIYNINNDHQTSGYIPSVKVFRLDGVDIIRGFTDDEANILSNGEDIDDLIIQDKAMFTNVKIEPRYFLDDSIAIGIFLDAGRIFLDSYVPANLRTSIGASLKLLTPVGALNFDYGIKTNRNHDAEGRKDSFGRFNLSIGFF